MEKTFTFQVSAIDPTVKYDVHVSLKPLSPKGMTYREALLNVDGLPYCCMIRTKRYLFGLIQSRTYIFRRREFRSIQKLVEFIKFPQWLPSGDERNKHHQTNYAGHR